MNRNQHMKLRIMKKLPSNFINKPNNISYNEQKIDDPKINDKCSIYIEQIEIFKLELGQLNIIINKEIINTDEF